ncbi:NAD(P)/FAD-dependent oxidoreductase [Mangrovicella endophytica]|uniref:NAD(P)/FAD-dependent oxidoreductase n=1 Tax=Mangrovicella endophytica TaxID=2066697 RepID=UPI000C9E9A92|nr:FAD-dependent oxidoreductase [Mangrovicella endophytica]
MRDAVVIGGGLVGAAIAWGLARQGLKPLVLDEDDLARRASRANFALIWVQGKGARAPHYARWTLGSARSWPGFAEELTQLSGIDIKLRQPGGFTLCLSDAELEDNAATLAGIRRDTGGEGASFEILDHRRTAELLPGLGRAVVGSTYSSEDGDVNSLRLFRALHVAMARSGVSYRAHSRVETIHYSGGLFRLEGPWGTVEAQKLILAGGIDNGRLASMVGLNVPLQHSKGQIVVTEKLAPFLAYPLGTLRQTDEGGVMIGDSEDTVDTSPRADPAINAVMVRRAIQMFPGLADVNMVRSWAGFRVKSRDGLPVYEQSAACPGAFVAVAHSGVTLAAAHALALAPQIAAGPLSRELSPFSTARFHVQAAA